MTDTSAPNPTDEWIDSFFEKVSSQTIDLDTARAELKSALNRAESSGYERGYQSGHGDAGALAKDAAQQATALRKIGSYQYGERVEILVRGLWVPGIVNNADAATNLVVVDTESGPHTLNSARAIRPIQA